MSERFKSIGYCSTLTIPSTPPNNINFIWFIFSVHSLFAVGFQASSSPNKEATCCIWSPSLGMSLKSGVCSSVLLSVAFAAIAAFKAWLVVFGQSTTALMVLSFVLPLHSILFFFYHQHSCWCNPASPWCFISLRSTYFFNLLGGCIIFGIRGFSLRITYFFN